MTQREAHLTLSNLVTLDFSNQEISSQTKDHSGKDIDPNHMMDVRLILQMAAEKNMFGIQVIY